MQLDFHYYAVYQLALVAGFTAQQAETIAYASQYVDDATESAPIEIGDDQVFDPVRTAHYNLEAFHWDVQKKVYMPFHYLPMISRRENSKEFRYIVRKATGRPNELATRIVEDAIREKDENYRLIRLGIALHTVVDTFSHHGFSGRHNDENKVRLIYRCIRGGQYRLMMHESWLADKFIPRIGHVEATKYPDVPYFKWKYTRIDQAEVKRDNLKDSLAAVKLVYHFLKKALDPDGPPGDLESENRAEYKRIKSLLSQKDELEERCLEWSDYTGAPLYSKYNWREEALAGDNRWDHIPRAELGQFFGQIKGLPTFDRSNWAMFHRGAFKQRFFVLDWLN